MEQGDGCELHQWEEANDWDMRKWDVDAPDDYNQ